MYQNIKTILRSTLVLALLALSFHALAVWTDPTATPPGANPEPPVNVSLTAQRKSGALIAGALRSDTSIVGVENGIFGALDVPNASSVLELRSTTKGFLPPRMNKAQRDLIATPAIGLLIYQTDNTPGFYFFDGSFWVPVGTGGGGGGGGGLVNDGTGQANFLSKFTGLNTLGNSSISDNGNLILADSDFKIGKKLLLSTLAITVNTGNTTNLELGNATYFKLDGSNSMTIEGFAPPSGGSHINGRIVYITNNNQSNTFTIKNNSSLCNLTNRIKLSGGEDLKLRPNQTITLIYNEGFPGGARWVQFTSPDNVFTGIDRLLAFSVRLNGSNLEIVKTKVLSSNNPADINKEVTICNFNGSLANFEFKAHFDSIGAGCNASTGLNIDSNNILSTQFIRKGVTGKYILLSNTNTADRIEFNVYTMGVAPGGSTPLEPDDEVYFTVILPGMGQ